MGQETRQSSSSKRRRSPTPARGLWTAARHPPPGQDHQGQVASAAPYRVWVWTVAAPNVMDQLALGRHCRRPNTGGRQTQCREPTQRTSPAL